MFGRFGTAPFGTSEFLVILAPGIVERYIALLGDSSNHGGIITSSNQEGTLKVNGVEVAEEGALHSCPIKDHGVRPVSAAVVKSFHNSKLIITQGAIAGCGAKISPPDRKVYIE